MMITGYFMKRCSAMAMNYDKLWKLLIDKKMMKKDLVAKSGISTNSMANMGKVWMSPQKCLGRYVRL